MTKKHFLLISALICMVFTAVANNAYKSMADGWLWNWDGKTRTKICEIAKGDTVYATSETPAYIAAHDSLGVSNLPVEYKGKTGEIYFSNFYPIKLDPSEQLTYVQKTKLKNRTPLERFCVPAMEWAMNHSKSPSQWPIVILILTAVTAASCYWGMSAASRAGIIICGISLIATSAVEVFYTLAYHQHLLWFIYPSQCGGWGHVILDFLLLALVIAVQFVGLYCVWTAGLSSGSDSTPDWIEKLVFVPALLGVALVVMLFIDGGEMPLSTYLIAFSALLIPTVVGLIWLLTRKRVAEALTFPIIFLLGSVGLTISLMVMSMLIIIVVIAVVALVFGISVLSAGASSIGRDRVDVITNDGRTVSGTRNWDGTVSGDDGRTYRVE